ncbi:MAG: hypothetical protein L6R39_006439 [Caloplaca ligustica]|nr:MAG: hypothetical protein L6R39_006439 [Caloplaca ligustica]
MPSTSTYDDLGLRDFPWLTISSVSLNQYMAVLQADQLSLKLPSPTPSQKQAILDTRWEARDKLPELTTSTDIINQLLMKRRALRQALNTPHPDDFEQLYVAFRVAITAIKEEQDRDWAYRQDLRRFFEIARPKMCEAYGLIEDPSTIQAGDLIVPAFEGFELLTTKTARITVEDVGNEDELFDRIRRHWRWLGTGAASAYDALYELVRGQPLLNE